MQSTGRIIDQVERFAWTPLVSPQEPEIDRGCNCRGRVVRMRQRFLEPSFRFGDVAVRVTRSPGKSQAARSNGANSQPRTGVGKALGSFEVAAVVRCPASGLECRRTSAGFNRVQRVLLSARVVAAQ